MANKKHGAASYRIVGNEVFRYVNPETGKQETASNAVIYRIGEVEDISLVDLMPASERTFIASPWAYKPATDAAVARGAYRTVKRGETVYTLAVNKDGDAIPRVLTGAQAVRMVADAMSDAAAAILRDADAVGMHVTYSPENEWSATATAVKSGAARPNRKNRHGRNDGDATARKSARAAARKSARASK